MDQQTKSSIGNVDTWKRGLFMLVFALISGVTKLLVTLVAIFQFFTLLIKGQTNASVLPFGQNLSTYIYQITLFLTFKTEDMPFPFQDFPNDAPTAKNDVENTDVVVEEPAESTEQNNTSNLAGETP